MSEYLASNGTWLVRNGGHLGFGATREEAGKRAGYGSGGSATDMFLRSDEWEALEEFIRLRAVESSERNLYGYRITAGAMEGAEVWPHNLDGDDDWLPFHENPHVPQIRISGDDPVESIRTALARAGVDGVPLRRVVGIAWGPVEVVRHGE